MSSRTTATTSVATAPPYAPRRKAAPQRTDPTDAKAAHAAAHTLPRTSSSEASPLTGRASRNWGRAIGYIILVCFVALAAIGITLFVAPQLLLLVAFIAGAASLLLIGIIIGVTLASGSSAAPSVGPRAYTHPRGSFGYRSTGPGYISQELIENSELGLGGNPTLTKAELETIKDTQKENFLNLFTTYLTLHGEPPSGAPQEIPPGTYRDAVQALRTSGLNDGEIVACVLNPLDEEIKTHNSQQTQAIALAFRRAIKIELGTYLTTRNQGYHLTLTAFFNAFTRNGHSLDGLRVGPEGARFTIEDFIEALHTTKVRSPTGVTFGISDAEIDEIVKTFAPDETDADLLADFKAQLQIKLKKYRYERLARFLHDGRHTAIQIEEVLTRGDGNCFLDSCSKGLARVAPSARQYTYRDLRAAMVPQFERLISEDSREGRFFRERFLVGIREMRIPIQVGDIPRGRECLPTFEDWTDEVLAQFPRVSRTELAKDEDDQLLTAFQALHPSVPSGTTHKQYANYLKRLLRQQENYALDPWEDREDHLWERHLFITHGYHYLTVLKPSSNKRAILDEMARLGVGRDGADRGRKLTAFRKRLRNLYAFYHTGIETDRTFNSGLETLLVAHVLQRPIVVLERGEGRRLTFKELTGPEYLQPLDQLADTPPITVILSPTEDRRSGHYTLGVY